MLKMLASAVSLAIVAAGAASALNVDTEQTMNALLAESGISQPVMDCARQALAGKTADELSVIIDEAATAGSSESNTPLTVEQAAVYECLKLDPLGWAGTDNEWAIPLVSKYMKGGN
jgi:hypothetical protein